MRDLTTKFSALLLDADPSSGLEFFIFPIVSNSEYIASRKFKLFNESSLLAEYAQKTFVEKAAVIAGECAGQLVDILEQFKKFQAYEISCAVATPEDQDIHDRIYQSVINLDQMLSATIIQLARMEGMIDEENKVIDHPKKKDS